MAGFISVRGEWRKLNWKLVGTAATGALLLSLLSPAARAESNTVRCSLQRINDTFSGSCTIPCSVNNLAIDIDGVNPRRACDSPARVVSVTLKQVQGDNWLGTMQGKEPEDPTRFEISKGKNGAADVAKLPFGWFNLAEFRLEGGGLSLTINADRTVPPTSDDLRIVQRTRQLLSDPGIWNKNDDRRCPPNPQKWSLFCALTQATTEIAGGVHYRQPALQVVREVLNELDGSRVRLHRLMEYNNDPQTSLEDIHNLLGLAQQRLAKVISARK